MHQEAKCRAAHRPVSLGQVRKFFLLSLSFCSLTHLFQQTHCYLSSSGSLLSSVREVLLLGMSMVGKECFGLGGGGIMREEMPSVWSGPTVSTFSIWIIISQEHLFYYSEGVFVLLPDLNDITQGLALSSWKLESEWQGRILSIILET